MPIKIFDVYHANLQQAMQQMATIAHKYKFIGVDSEFPGYFQNIDDLSRKLNKPPPPGRTNYDVFKYNIDNLKLIQLGISFCDEQGNFANPAVFQFNFDFNFNKEIIQDQSKQFLREHIKETQLHRFEKIGIFPAQFSAMFAQSGLLANPDLTWFFFHGNQDLGYFVKTILMQPLAPTLNQFNQSVRKLFPQLYDVKVFMKWDLGLVYLIDTCNVQREGSEHNAGSDAYVTLKVAIQNKHEWGSEGVIFGLAEDQISLLENQE